VIAAHLNSSAIGETSVSQSLAAFIPDSSYSSTATRSFMVPVVVTQADASTHATGTFSRKRRAFQIGQSEWADTSMVTDDVRAKFKFALTGVGNF